MKQKLITNIIIIIMTIHLISCTSGKKASDINIIFLHHSTGRIIWNGKSKSKIAKFIRSKSNRIANIIGAKAQLPSLIEKYNKQHSKNYLIKEMVFPRAPYAMVNYPYDYYNIWVKNGNKSSYKNEPTLKTLCPLWDVIVFKHCFPVSDINEDETEGNIDSDIKTIPNYKLQYNALKAEMLKYPDTKFILWTGATLTQKATGESRAIRARDFFTWVKDVWDEEGDNIFLWDFYDLETEGELYMKQEYALGEKNSHPNKEFSAKVAPLLCQRVVDVELNNGSKTDLHGCYIGTTEE